MAPLRLLLAAAVATLAVTAAAPSAGAVDRSTRVRLGAAPVGIALAAGDLWAVVETPAHGATLLRLDARTGRRIASYRIGSPGPDLGAVTATGSTVWAAAGEHAIRVDIAHPGRVRRAELPGEASAITTGFGSVWIATIGVRSDLLVRLAAPTLASQTAIPVDQPVAILAAAGSVWIAGATSLDRVQPRTGRAIATRVPVGRPVALAAAGQSIVVVDAASVTTVDRSGRSERRLPLPFSASAVALDGPRLWVTSNCGCPDGRTALLAAGTGRVAGTWRTGETPVAIAADGGVAWIASFGDGSLWRIVAP
jgi:hypothetical protein